MSTAFASAHTSEMTATEIARLRIDVRRKLAGFNGPLVAEKLRGRLWKVHESFVYEVGHDEVIYVPRGFVTDLASVPRPFWPICPTDDGYSQAAVLHDWLCRHQGKVEKFYTVRRTSEIFYNAMRELGIGKLRAGIMFRAVLHFGPQWDKPSTKRKK